MRWLAIAPLAFSTGSVLGRGASRWKPPTCSTAVGSPLNKFAYRLIDPAIMLDEWDKWSALWSEIFLGGKPVAKE